MSENRKKKKRLGVSDLARETGGGTEENVFPQRDCIQSPENCNLRYEFITRLLLNRLVSVCGGG